MLSYAPIDEAFNDFYSKKKSSKKAKKEQFATEQTTAAYTAQQSDMNYACRNFGVCPPAYKSNVIEGFDPNEEQCEPLKVPQPGDHAHAEMIKQQMESMNKALSVTQADYQPTPYKPHLATSVPMEMDEELQEYLNSAEETVHQTVTAPASPSTLPTEPTVTEEAPSVVTEEPLIQPDPIPVDKTKKWIELGIFIFMGLLLIFFFDQMVKIGIMIGMKQTTQFLEPFVEYAQALASNQ